jgi:hypothetical protein
MTDIEVPAGYSVRALSSPLVLDGTVVAGFGRGSKELGCPTANLDRNDVGVSITDVPAGVYFGWAYLNGGSAEMMVMSIGWCVMASTRREFIHKLPPSILTRVLISAPRPAPPKLALTPQEPILRQQGKNSRSPHIENISKRLLRRSSVCRCHRLSSQ